MRIVAICSPRAMEAWSVGIRIVSTGTSYLFSRMRFHFALPMIYRTTKASTSSPIRLPSKMPIHLKDLRIMSKPFAFLLHTKQKPDKRPCESLTKNSYFEIRSIVNFIVTSISGSLSKPLPGRIRKFTYLVAYFASETK